MKKVVILVMKVFAIVVLVMGINSALSITVDNVPRVILMFMDPSLVGALQGLVIILAVLLCILLLGFAIHLENQEIIATELKQLNDKVQWIESVDGQDSKSNV